MGDLVKHMCLYMFTPTSRCSRLSGQSAGNAKRRRSVQTSASANNAVKLANKSLKDLSLRSIAPNICAKFRPEYILLVLPDLMRCVYVCWHACMCMCDRYMVVDEAHRIRNSTTVTSLAVRSVGEQAQYRVALTGEIDV